MNHGEPIEIHVTLGRDRGDRHDEGGYQVVIRISDRDITIECSQQPSVMIWIDENHRYQIGAQSMKTGEVVFSTKKEQ